MSIEMRVKQIIVEQLGVDEGEVVANAMFVDDLGADSLDVVELIMAFEEEFGIEIPLENFNYFLSQPNTYEYKEVPYKTCDLAFIADFPDEEIILEKDEIAEVKWVSINEINLDDIGFDSLRKVVEIYINSLK